jgi:hypothetical protein
MIIKDDFKLKYNDEMWLVQLDVLHNYGLYFAKANIAEASRATLFSRANPRRSDLSIESMNSYLRIYYSITTMARHNQYSNELGRIEKRALGLTLSITRFSRGRGKVKDDNDACQD